jgi:MFS family permease
MNRPQKSRFGLTPQLDRLRSTFSSLGNRDYRFYWVGLLASSTGQQMQLVVRGWLVYELTDSPLALGLVSAGAGIPILVFSLFGGVIVDRFDKRKLLVITQSVTGVATLCVAVLISTGAIEMWHLIIAAVVNGTVLSVDLPTRQAIIPQLVEQRQVMNAVALGSGAMNLTRVVAPALGGVLVGVMGIDGVYFLMVAFYAVSAAVLFRIPPVRVVGRVSGASFHRDLLDGVRYIRRSHILLALLTMAVVPIAFGMPYQMLMPVFAVDVLDLGASGLGYLMAATGVGALVGSIALASLGDFRHKGSLLLIASALFGAFLAFFATSTHFYLALFLLVMVGLTNSVYMATNNTLLQINADDHMRGRVMSLYMMTIGLLPTAVLPASAIAESLGAPVAVGAGGAIVVVFTVVIALFRPTLRRL